jgi:hypothetical protein
MSDSENLTFLAQYAQPAKALASAAHVEDLLEAYRSDGYALTDGYAWPFSAPANPRTTPSADVSAGVVTAIDTLHFWRYPFEFELTLDSVERRQFVVQASVETLWGPARDLAPANTTAFIEAVKQACAALGPDFGCAFWGRLDPPNDLPARPEAAASVYPLVYIGPNLLTASGRAHLLAAPAEVSAEIGGGLLIVRRVESLYRSQ